MTKTRNVRPPEKRGSKRSQSHGAASESILVRVSNWAVYSVAASIIVGMLSTALITGGAYILYGAQNELDQQDSVIDRLALRSAQYQLGADMSSVFSTGWNAPSTGNLNRLSELVRTLSEKKNEEELDANWARAAIEWCTKAGIQLDSEQAIIKAFLANDEFIKRQQSILIADYGATVKLVDAVREMILQWAHETPQQRATRFGAIEAHAREARKTEAELEGVGRQFKSYWDPIRQQDRTAVEHARHGLGAIRTKLWLAFIGIVFGAILLGLSAGVVVIRTVSSNK